MNDFVILLFAFLFVSLFYFYTYKLFPLGVALVITGAGFAAIPTYTKGKIAYWIGTLGSWLYPIGVIYAFVKNGWKWGLFSIFISFIAYGFAKSRSSL